MLWANKAKLSGWPPGKWEHMFLIMWVNWRDDLTPQQASVCQQILYAVCICMSRNVFLWAYICDFLFMHAEGLENHSRKEIGLMIAKQSPSTGAPALGSHLSHKEDTAGRCLQFCSFMGGTGGQRQRHVFSCIGKRVWRVPEGKDPDWIHLQVWRSFNEQFVNARVHPDKLDDNLH